MQKQIFKAGVIGSAAIFLLFFVFYVSPAALADGDIIGAFMAGFVNPYASGYAVDAIMCWCILCFWVIYERNTQGIKHGWLCLVLGVVPGVAVGFAAYLILRLPYQKPVQE
jgi:hypothetical protein